MMLQEEIFTPLTPSFKRFEYKYLIDTTLARQVVDFLKPFIVVDDNTRGDKSNTYTVRSIYFDSPDFKCYHEKITGLPNREKFRLRAYEPIDGKTTAFLECKRKNCRKGMKERVFIDNIILDAIEHNDYSILHSSYLKEDDRKTLEKFFFNVFRNSYMPVLLVTYDREPYIDPNEDRIRITLDKNLRAMAFPQIHDIYEEERLSSILGDKIVLEVKFDSYLPRWISDLTSVFGLIPQAVSKYCSSLAYFLGENPNAKDGYIHV